MILYRPTITLYVLLVFFKGATAERSDPEGGTNSGPGRQGINCRGSSQCSRLFNTVGSEHLIFAFNYTIWNRISDYAYFFKSQQIACAKNANWAVGGICLFVQGNVTSQGISGRILKERISDLAYHGCNYCGSVPISGDNNPDKAGLLTANYVAHPICNGICFHGEMHYDTAESPTLESTSAVLNQTLSTRSPPHTISVFTVHPAQPVHPGQRLSEPTTTSAP